jgi:aubergine-like protein
LARARHLALGGGEFARARARAEASACPVKLTRALALQVHLYDVSFEPDVPANEVARRRFLLLRFRASLLEQLGAFFFSGANLLGVREVRDTLEFAFQDDSKQNQRVRLRYVKAVAMSAAEDSSSIETMTLANLYLKKLVIQEGLQRLGRRYFSNEVDAIPRYRIELKRGFMAVVLATMSGPAVQIDLAHRVVQQGTVFDVMNSVRDDVERRYSRASSDEVKRNVRAACEERLTNVTIITRHNNVMYRIDRIDWDRSLDDTFPLRDGTLVSFRQYYKQKYGKELTQRWPGLLAHMPRRKRVNSPQSEELYFPPELCHLTGLTDEMRADHSLMRAIAEKTGMRPEQRLARSRAFITKLHQHSLDRNAREPQIFGILPQPMAAPSRVLGPFSVTLKQGSRESTQQLEGRSLNFSSSYRSSGLLDVKAPRKCVLIARRREEGLARTLVSKMSEVADRQGMRGVLGSVETRLLDVDKGGRGGVEAQWQAGVEDAVRALSPDFVIIVLPEFPTTLYSAVKTSCLVNTPVLSQVVLARNLEDAKKVVPVAGNVLKQILCKLGSVPWRVELKMPDASVSFTRVPTMVVGVDVCHDFKLNRSTVGFCASYSRDYFLYNSYVRYQQRGSEILAAAEELMYSAVTDFAARYPFPEQVLVFRDGVSSSEMQDVVRSEVAGFKRAFERRGCNPRLTVVVVQKQTGLRIFTEDGGNPPGGTVVDTGVASATESDFYLVPIEQYREGVTASPTRFVVVYDDCNFSANDIQTACNMFCLMYANWPGPVRVPAPCMLAHKLAFLAGKNVPKDAVIADALREFPFFL